MLVVAHRGLHIRQPENSLAAFDEAVGLGVDGIEVDVRLTADQKVVLFHDRVIHGGRFVARLEHAELDKLVGFHVPTLQEALGQHPGIFWNIEIKDFSALDVVVKILRESETTGRVLVSSFWHPMLDDVQRTIADIEVGLLFAHYPLAYDYLESPSVARVDSLIWHIETCSPALVERCTSLGKDCYVYGAVGLQEHEALRDWGASGAITDTPSLLL